MEKGGRRGSGEGFERDFSLGCTLAVMIPLFFFPLWFGCLHGRCGDIYGRIHCGEMEIGIARDRNHRTGLGILSICGDGVLYSIEVCIVLDGRILTKRLLSITPAAGDIHATKTSAAAIIAQDSLWQCSSPPRVGKADYIDAQ